MKKYLAIFMGGAVVEEKQNLSAEAQETFLEAWGEWVTVNTGAILDNGSPLGKTKKVSFHGTEESKNLITSYCVVEATSLEDASELFKTHPHITFFPKNSIEVTECLSLPTM